jgi:hypothetical protein
VLTCWFIFWHVCWTALSCWLELLAAGCADYSGWATDLSNRQVKQGCLTVAVGFRMCVRVCELNIDALLVDGLAGLQDYTLLFG